MNVYLACSSRDLYKYVENYKSIREAVLESDNKIVGDWLGRVIRKYEKENNKQKPPSLKDEGIKQLIHSDCLIADVSIPSASVGYQVGYALSRDIPVLCLYSSEFGQKKPPQIIGVSDLSRLKVKGYSKKSVKKAVADFLNSVPKELIKFNFIITPEIQNYISWGAKRNKISKSEFLREKTIQLMNDDEEYKKYKR